MNLASAFVRSAEINGQKAAIYWGEEEHSYGAILDRAFRLAFHLRQELGVKPGDRVALWLKNCPEFIPALFGILQAGAVAVPINNFLKANEVEYILADGEIDRVITDSSMNEALSALLQKRPGLKIWRVEDFSNLPGGRMPADREPTEKDLAIIIYTSGTTGRPKGAMLSHGNLLANVESCRQVLEAIDEDRFVVLLPLFHSFMLCVGLLLPLLVGGSILLAKSVHPVKNIVAEISLRQATILPAVPQFFRTFTHATFPEDFPLRLCISGGAPLPGEILREFNERFPIPLLEGYGLSEASPVVSFNPIHGPWKAGSIGVPIPGVKVSVQDDSGRILGPGETGEICVRGANVMQGYWKQPEETAKVMRESWLLTGDIGHRDTDGYFYITDRKKDMLLVNGINVYPREIEEVLYQFPGVKEAAVIGRPDERKGEQPIAFISTNEGVRLEERQVQQFIRERLADYKVPKRVLILETLPRNPTGKILKTALRELDQKSVDRTKVT